MAIAAQVPGPEIVSADAFTIYTGMDIGTAKPSREERASLPHHMMDIVDPECNEPFTVHDWLVRAERVIADIQSRGGTPIVVGGTNLYVMALLNGLFEGPEPDASLRETLRQIPIAELRAELERVDPVAAGRIHANDERRTIRALEVYRQTGTPISQLQKQWEELPRKEDRVLVGLLWPVEEINKRINARVKAMMEAGFLQEVTDLHRAGKLGPQAREALGYKQLLEHLEGRCTLDEAVEEIKIETRRFGKNQRTWLKRLRLTPRSVWIDVEAVAQEEWASKVLGAMAEH